MRIAGEQSRKEFHEFLQQSRRSDFRSIVYYDTGFAGSRTDAIKMRAPGCWTNNVAADGLYADALNVLVNLHKVRWNDDPAAVKSVYRTGTYKEGELLGSIYRGNLQKRG